MIGETPRKVWYECIPGRVDDTWYEITFMHGGHPEGTTTWSVYLPEWPNFVTGAGGRWECEAAAQEAVKTKLAEMRHRVWTDYD
jgi:hypothetical protein